MQLFSHPLALANAVLCFPSEPNIPEEPEYEIIKTLYRCTGRRLIRLGKCKAFLSFPLESMQLFVVFVMRHSQKEVNRL